MVGNPPNPPKQSNWSKIVFVFFPFIFLCIYVCICVMSGPLICVVFFFLFLSHTGSGREVGVIRTRWTTRVIRMAEGRRARQSTTQQTDPNSFRLFVHLNRPLKRIFTKLLWNYFISLSTIFKQERTQRTWELASEDSDPGQLVVQGLFLSCESPSETVSLTKIGHVTPDRKSESAGGMNLWPRAFPIL